jgi:hypothetical protein
MRIDQIAKKFDISLGQRGKMVKEEFLVMVTPTLFRHLTSL